jgi:putative Ca2+/H+ antiporter (TMEM165/GDT1 family)
LESLFSIFTPFVSSLVLIGLAELGDKTQLLTMTLATRYRPSRVIGGVLLATALLQLMAVSLGHFTSALLPINILKKGAAALFIAFGLWIILGKDGKEVSLKESASPLLTVFSLFFLAELGDKTQLAGIALAAKYDSFWQVWLGATLGMTMANSAGILIGNWLGKKVPSKWLKLAGGIIFILFGILSLWESFR